MELFICVLCVFVFVVRKAGDILYIAYHLTLLSALLGTSFYWKSAQRELSTFKRETGNPS